jgi:hypothetical protein
MMSFRLLTCLSVLVAVSACNTPKKAVDAATNELQSLSDQMAGYYTSAAQAAADKDFFDISLHMTPIWKNRKGEYWLYVEQAMTAKLDKPYRQRIYKLESEGSGKFKSIVYTLPDEAKYIGAWKDPKMLDRLKSADLSLREGCAVHLVLQSNQSYVGATNGSDCESNLRGAKYATSKVRITKKGIESWDQGFGAGGKQVWGATKGPYTFVKQ